VIQLAIINVVWFAKIVRKTVVSKILTCAVINVPMIPTVSDKIVSTYA
jgi:hypothetical protein